ncbi:DUF4142 domain-containing protein [Hymenobacter sp. PAMC 26628]|uniref:DUF4142 domain-containing protein n=1 Tax=Hymenobacter sp. PAMC 26628 TaxID=1484118 RepID=UPI000770331E|nr:DUF4142 domain-containing protein [Hymenobacter sp. PAMC 26628]AMJ67653.1 hypothetical protein AXW84_21210 [Hymenobacter sp. PAMC 26628]
MNRSLLPTFAAGLLAFSACNSADKSATASQPATTPATENAAPPMANTTDTAATAGAPGAGAMPPMSDADFITKVDEGGHNEMGLSKVVLTKNPSPTVKAYANKMIADHTKAGAELTPIAKAHGVKLKGMMDAEHQTIREAMLKMSGPDLEKKYMDQMVTDHDKTVALFQSEIANGKQADTKAFASKTLPTIQQHDSMAKSGDKMKM